MAAAWITGEDVASWLDVPYPDESGRIDLATAAAKAAVERRRSDLDFEAVDFATVQADVRAGSIRWAALIYQARNSPSGYQGYDAESALYYQGGSSRNEILQQIGWKRPAAI